jgi:hypothetical protein
MLLPPDIELPLGEPEEPGLPDCWLDDEPNWLDCEPDWPDDEPDRDDCEEPDCDDVPDFDDDEPVDCWFDWLDLFKLESEPILLPLPSFGFCVSMISFLF